MFRLHFEVLVGEPLVVRSHVPLAQPGAQNRRIICRWFVRSGRSVCRRLVLSVVTLPIYASPSLPIFFGKRFVLRTSTCAHVVSPRDITCSIIPRDGRGRARLVRTRFHLRPLICPTAIFNSPYPHPVEIGAVDAVAGSDDPPLGDEGAAATDPLAQEALFDDGHL